MEYCMILKLNFFEDMEFALQQIISGNVEICLSEKDIMKLIWAPYYNIFE